MVPSNASPIKLENIIGSFARKPLPLGRGGIALVFNVLLDDFNRGTAASQDEIRGRPQFFTLGSAGRNAFESVYELAD